MNRPKNVLMLSSQEAFDFFMNAGRYCTFELPTYLDFQPILDFVKNKIKNKKYESCLLSDPRSMANVNLDILLNKDGKYAIRPLALVNPYLYYFLVRDLCDNHNWELIRDSFDKFNLKNITACAIPVIPDEKESFHSSTTILNWWNALEQRSVELSLEYRYMFVSDITNCYGSINPQTIDSALSMQGTKYATSERHELADRIVMYLRALQNGRNVGIPQGSEVFNLLAEIILGYADLLLAKEIEKAGSKCKYKVLRYRDDYRIFCDYKDKLEDISYVLQRILSGLNFQMNSKKTMVSDSIITDSIKADKLFYIFNTPIYKRRRVYKLGKDKDGNEKIVSSIENDCDFNGLQKNLLFILLFGRKYPNSGQIRTQLNEFDARLSKMLEDKDASRGTFVWDEVDLDDEYCTKLPKSNRTENDAQHSEAKGEDDSLQNIKTRHFRPIRESIRPMVAIATQIAAENISAAHYALRIVRLVETLDDDDTDKKDIIRKVCGKLRNQHNTNYLEVWLQHITYNADKVKNESNYTQPLCRFVMGERILLWNNDWLVQSLRDEFPYGQICCQDKLKEVTPVIKIKARNDYCF
jgi:RNA-directed DNA polymerase